MENNTVNATPQLQKKLSPFNVWALALGCIIGWGAFVMPGNTFLPNAGPAGTAIAMGIAAVIMIIIAINYQFMIQKYPIAGGEFTYTQNAFGKNPAFICAWFLGLSYLAIVPLNATALALIGRNLLPGVFQFGFHYSVAGYDIYLGEIILALAALFIFAILSIRGVKTSGMFQTILVFMIVIGVAIVGLAAIFSSKASFANLTPAFNPNTSPIAGTIAVIAVAPWAFVGFDTVPQASEEFKFSPKKSKLLMVVAIIFGGAIYVVLNTITAAVVPDGFANWSEYIAASKDMTGLAALPTFNAAHELLGTPGLVFLAIAVIGAVLSGICGFYMATSRLLYSMSKENVLPKAFGKLHPKHNTPHIAIIFIMVIAFIAPFFGRTALGWIVDMSSLGAAIGYLFTSAAAFKYAKREKHPAVIVTGIIGVIMAAIFAVLLLVPIPGLSCSLGKESYICLIVWIALGILFFCVSRKRRKAAEAQQA